MTSSRTKAATVLALALTATLTACSSDGTAPRQAASPIDVTTAAPATATSPATSPVTSAPAATTSPTQAQPSSQKIVLFGSDLGPATFGDPFDTAVSKLSAVLGKATETETVTCIRGDRQVSWGDFTVTSEDGKLSGWLSTSPTLATPSGVRVGTTVATLRRIYGSKLEISTPPGAESVTEFTALGSIVAGSLDGDGTSAGDKVDALYTSACSQP